MTISRVFDPKLNALNAVRLAMAIGVILWHSFPLVGQDVEFHPLRQFMAEVWVDGFFAISGYLITSSWIRRPDLRAYVSARAFRILPAFWVCLIVTAFVAAPVGVRLQMGDARALMLTSAPYEYIASNAFVWMFQFDIGGTPNDVPYPHVWNGSLWTLGYEVLCYIAILLLGVCGLLLKRFTIPAAFVGAWLVLVASEFVELPSIVAAGGRFSLMFLAGALIHQYRDSVCATWSLVGVGTVLTIASMWLPDYRMLGAVPWAYVVIVAGILLKHRRLVLRQDLSYGTYIYAFPIQQLLVIGGAATLNPLLFAALATVATIPAAAASWFLVEKPAMALKARSRSRSRSGT